MGAFKWPFVHRTVAEIEAAGQWPGREGVNPRLLFDKVAISATQAVIVSTLRAARGQFVTGAQLNAALGYPRDARVLKVHICYLRKRIFDHGLPDPIESEIGFGSRGYRWAAA